MVRDEVLDDWDMASGSGGEDRMVSLEVVEKGDEKTSEDVESGEEKEEGEGEGRRGVWGASLTVWIGLTLYVMWRRRRCCCCCLR